MISTVLIDSEARPSQRARVISAWVDVAQVLFQQQQNASNKKTKSSSESEHPSIPIFFKELRVLKNFSSLKAIVSGLQSNPIFRLKKAWQVVNTIISASTILSSFQAVSREKLEMFEELARIFSEDNNAVAQRELLVRSKPMMERRKKDRL